MIFVKIKDGRLKEAKPSFMVSKTKGRKFIDGRSNSKLAYIVALIMKIVIIGTGNVGTIAGRLLLQAGHQIIQVYGRNEIHASLLAAELHCRYCNAWDDIDKAGDIYIAALSDMALGEMSASLRLPARLIVHTAGSIPMHILKPVSENYGVLYPLQSLRKEFPASTDIPFLIDASNEKAGLTLLSIASGISSVVKHANDEERGKLHVAAVIVNNFTNHLYALAEQFCIKEDLDFKLLLPLIQETASRMERITPAEALTGPAIRNDHLTIQKHLDLLSGYPPIKKLYEDLTESIRTLH